MNAATKKKKTIYISFVTQKGGAGKSSLTILVASMMHYALGYDVAIIDCDETQYSIADMRQYDEKHIFSNGQLKRIAEAQFSQHKKGIYPVLSTTIMNAYDVASQLRQENGQAYDFIFFDLPGSVNAKGWLSLIAVMDYLFVPFAADLIDINSTMAFLKIVVKMANDGSSEVVPFVFWNKVDAREKTELFDIYNKAVADLGVSVLKTSIPSLSRFHKKITDVAVMDGVFCSTVLSPSNKLLAGSHVDWLCDEILEVVRL
jgi:cellulose biosynthesis protein BcsQ